MDEQRERSMREGANQGISDCRKNAILAGEAYLGDLGGEAQLRQRHYECDEFRVVSTCWSMSTTRWTRTTPLWIWEFCPVGGPSNAATTTCRPTGYSGRGMASDAPFGTRPLVVLTRDAAAAEQELRHTETAAQLARRGLPGKTIQRLTGAPVADPTPAVVAAMRAKFPGRPPHQATSSRSPAPPANEVSRGAAPGPSGLQPGFLQQLVGRGAEEGRALPLITALGNLLADGGAPAGLRPYLGALHKVSKTGGADVRPLCAGEAFRRLVGKVLLRSELPALREQLLPHQLALGVRSGAGVVPHLYANGSTITAMTWTGFAFPMTRGMPTTRSTTMCS